MRKSILYAVIALLVVVSVFSQLAIHALRERLRGSAGYDFTPAAFANDKAKAKKDKCSGSSNGTHTEGKWDACAEDDFISVEEAKIESYLY